MNDVIRKKYVKTITKKVKDEWKEIQDKFHSKEIDSNQRDMKVTSLVGSLSIIADACDNLVDVLLEKDLKCFKEDKRVETIEDIKKEE